MKRLERRNVWILAMLAALVVITAACSRLGELEPRLNGAAPGEPVTVGAYGPLVLTFSQPVQAGALEQAFQLDPLVEGRFSWDGEAAQSVRYWPETPLVPGQRYTLRLKAGFNGEDGAALRGEKTWQVEVRQPELLYLSPSQAPELWQVSADGKNPRPLTASGGQVYDFSVSRDGARILYSARNEQGGIDLWELARGAKEASLLLPCGTDWCYEAAYSPDLRKVAYSRRTFSGIAGSEPGVPRLWIYDPVEKSTDALLAEPALGGTAPAWSPDGRYLAFTDPLSEAARVVDFQARTDFFVRAGAETRVAWMPSSASFFITKPESGEDFPFVLIYEVEAATREARQWVENPELSEMDYSLPVPSPDGQWLALARRQVGGGSGKQIWRVRLDGSQPEAVTQDPLANHAGYQWDPSSQRLVFQRLSLRGSDSLPEVLLWDVKSSQPTLIAKDAFLPRWLP